MINITNVNPNLIKAEYAVRGKIVDRAQQLEKEGKKIIYCNIGNPQALKQKPLTYIRQVLSLVEFPELLNKEETERIYPKDLIERAKFILKNHPHGTGAYTQSPGIQFIRKAIAEYIQRRDNIPSSENNIILTDGASKGVQSVLMTFLKNSNDGFMIPIPQYPLYSATIALYGGSQVGYYLDESNDWELNRDILIKSIEEAKKNGINPVALVVINPGNPTGAVLSYENIKMVIEFAKNYNLCLMADEVYQENIYKKGKSFNSFAKVMHDTGETEIPLFSFHSTSKGFYGECGHRGGYVEARNVPKEVMEQFMKIHSISLCANVNGQIVTYLVVTPPQERDESYGQYKQEKSFILNELKAKSEIIGKGLNEIEGMTTDIPDGAMYAFVKLDLPHTEDVTKMTPEERKKYDSKRDFDYCLALVEETGICVVPGSGFGQMPGTLHFRTTILPPRDEVEILVEKIKVFHELYVKKLKK